MLFGAFMRFRPAVYFLASRPRGVVYVGVTNDLLGRVLSHKQGLGGEFSRQYGVKLLVWYEFYDSMNGAILREKLVKNWGRSRKLALIEKYNSDWFDLYYDVFDV